jgi:hypothetical protein
MSLHTDQWIQVINAAGTWVAGIGTLAAVIVSLHLARDARQVRLQVYAGVFSYIRGDGTPFTDCLYIDVTNMADRTVIVQSVGWKIGSRKAQRYALQTVELAFGSDYPVRLEFGQKAGFATPLASWLINFPGFIRDDDLRTLVAQVHTAVGQTIEVKPSTALLEALKQPLATYREQIAQAKAPTASATSQQP